MIVAMGALHFFQRSAEQRNYGIASVLKALKWILILLAVIAALLVLLFGSFVVSLFKYTINLYPFWSAVKSSLTLCHYYLEI